MTGRIFYYLRSFDSFGSMVYLIVRISEAIFFRYKRNAAHLYTYLTIRPSHGTTPIIIPLFADDSLA
jgi:hypothetical protein